MSDESQAVSAGVGFPHLRHVPVSPAIRNRKKYLSNIWIFESPKNNIRIVVEGDVAFMHLVLLEGDIHIARYNANPDPVSAIVDGEVRQTKLDAVVYLHSGHCEWWEFKRATDATAHRVGRAKPQLTAQAQAASIAGVPYRIKTDADLAGKAVRFDNWLLLCAAMTRVRGMSTHHELKVIDQKLNTHEQILFGSLLSDQTIDAALMLGAVAKMLQIGLLVCDLDNELFGPSSYLQRGTK